VSASPRPRAEYDATDLVSAIADAEAALETDREDPTMAQIVAFGSIFVGDFKKAEAAVRDALKRHPEHLAFLYLACKIALLKGERERALQLAQRLLDHHDESPEANALAADCFMVWGQARTARSLLEKAVLLGNTAPDPFYHLGCICLGDGDLAAALRSFLYAIQSGKRGSEAQLRAAYCYRGLGDLGNARAMCAQALAQGAALAEIHEIDPEWRPARS
jgi:Flp pilus assembly protein TadD